MATAVRLSVDSARDSTGGQEDVYAFGYASPYRRGEVVTGMLALVSTICGGGSLSIPWAFAKSGASLGFAILTISAVLSAFGVHFLLCGARRAGGLKTFDQVLEAALGPWARLLTIWSVVVTCFLTLVANSLLLRQLMTPLAAEFVFERYLSRAEEVTLGSILVSLVVPLTYLTSLNSLRHVSLMSVSSVTALIAALAYKGFACVPDLANGAEPAAADRPPELPTMSDVVRSLPVFVCIFICSFSALPLDTELRQPSRKRMTTMVVGAFVIAYAMYAVAGFAGLAYGRCKDEPVASNVLKMFPKGDGIACLLRVLLSIVLLLSLPLICLPCRNMIHQLLSGCRRDCCAPLSRAIYKLSPTLGEHLLPSPAMDEDYSSDDDDTPRFERAFPHGTRKRASSVGEGVFGTLVKEDGGELPLGVRVALSSSIMGATLLCTANVDDVSVVWGFLGSTCGILLSYVLPAASYLLLRRTPTAAKQPQNGVEPPADFFGSFNSGKKTTAVHRRKLMAAILLVVGVCLMPICVYNTLATLQTANVEYNRTAAGGAGAA